MILNEVLLTQIIYGSAFLGSGGGGAIESGLKFLKEIVSSGKQIKLITFPLSEVDHNLPSCIVCDIGSISKFAKHQSNALLFALNGLTEYFENFDDFKAFFPIETGPENTMAPFVLASKFEGEVCVVDGDGAGRAVPTLPLTSFFERKKLVNPSPIAIANGRGDMMLVDRPDFTKFDVILRHVANLEEFEASASLAMWPDKVGNLAVNCIEGAISRALRCGQLFECIRENKVLDTESLLQINELKAYLICRGIVKQKIEADEDAFKFTTITIKNEKNTFTVLAQNENIIVYNKELSAPIAIAPDSICYLTTDFQPLTNVEIKRGHEVYVIGVKAHKKLLSNRMLSSFKRILLDFGYGGNILTQTEVQPLGDLILNLGVNK